MLLFKKHPFISPESCLVAKSRSHPILFESPESLWRLAALLLRQATLGIKTPSIKSVCLGLKASEGVVYPGTPSFRHAFSKHTVTDLASHCATYGREADIGVTRMNEVRLRPYMDWGDIAR